jgi:tRNA-2-methylthio-N6-dimethylallyladenosine synthase
MLNQVTEVIVDGPSKSDAATQTGRTRQNKLVHFSADQDLTGKLVKVKITNIKTWNLLGEITGVSQ